MSDAPVKKGRGRPAKSADAAEAPKKAEKAPPKDDLSAEEENGGKVAPAKKGRGRPAASPAAKAAKAAKTASKRPAADSSGAKRGRGRPPKNAKKAAAVSSEEDDADDAE